jgi:TM2 domain-containing membrane protein YozV
VSKKYISLEEKMGMVFCRGCGKEIHETALSCPNCGALQNTAMATSTKSQSVAALLAAFLGGFGIHRFYLGKIVSGILYLIFCWTGIPGIFVIAFMSQEEWATKYNNGRISAPVNGGIKILALVFPIIFVISILAAIAIPAYHDYTVRARAAQTT